jgi:hypothetical protein
MMMMKAVHFVKFPVGTTTAAPKIPLSYIFQHHSVLYPSSEVHTAPRPTVYMLLILFLELLVSFIVSSLERGKFFIFSNFPRLLQNHGF